MLVKEQALALHEAVEQMGYTSVEDFALRQAKEKLMYEMNTGQKHIEVFEQKYKMDYVDFCKQFHELPQPLFEREEDSAEWNAELKPLHILQKRFSRLLL